MGEGRVGKCCRRRVREVLCMLANCVWWCFCSHSICSMSDVVAVVASARRRRCLRLCENWCCVIVGGIVGGMISGVVNGMDGVKLCGAGDDSRRRGWWCCCLEGGTGER